jgi:hypothetical protein
MGILASNVERTTALGKVSQQAMVKLVEYTSSILGTCMQACVHACIWPR